GGWTSGGMGAGYGGMVGHATVAYAYGDLAPMADAPAEHFAAITESTATVDYAAAAPAKSEGTVADEALDARSDVDAMLAAATKAVTPPAPRPAPGADLDGPVPPPAPVAAARAAADPIDLGADRPPVPIEIPKAPRGAAAAFTFGDDRKGWVTRIPEINQLPSVAYGGGKVFVSGGFESVSFYALDATDGHVAWASQALEDNGPTAPIYDE